MNIMTRYVQPAFASHSIMRAMILAAGRGERMGALTVDTPKPLLRVAGKYLIEYTLSSLARAGIRDIVINVSYHAEQIKSALGNGQQCGVEISYSEEENVWKQVVDFSGFAIAW